MTYPAGLSMPGAFYADGAGVPVSQPPSYLHSASGEYSEKSPPSSTPKRKRVRGGEGLLGVAKPQTPPRSYTLAGTLDTPAGGDPDLGPCSDVLEDSLYSESNYRTSFGSKRIRDDDHDTGNGAGPTPLFQLPAEPGSPSNGWGTIAMGVVGGVVGKVWEFCKAGAFKGFYAGGGQAYAMGADGTVAPDHAPPIRDDDYTYGFDNYRYDDYEHRVPGRFPRAQADERGRSSASQRFADSRATTPVPAGKRRQTAPANELRSNWVIVKDLSTASPAPLSSTPRKTSGGYGYRSSPRNRNHGPSVTTGRRINTPGSRRNSVHTPTNSSNNHNNYYRFDPEESHDRPSSSASFASPRSSSPTKSSRAAAAAAAASQSPYSSSAMTVNVSSSASVASPSANHGRTNTSTHRRRGSHMSGAAAAVTSSHRRTQSSASAASSRGEELDVDASPRLDAEAKHLATRRKLEERDADVRISAFNKRLQDMIRQGREALGTTIEIDEGGEAEWEDEQ